MIIYTDGGCNVGEFCLRSGFKIGVEISYGAVIHHNGTSHELSGRYSGEEFCNMHEFVAFIEAMIFAENHTSNLNKVVLYTDCDFLAWYGKEGGSKTLTKNLRERLTKLNSFYSFDVPSKIDYWLRLIRIHFVKGHSYCMDHNRADYLARSSLRKQSALNRDDWYENHYRAFQRKSASITTWRMKQQNHISM